ncbi:MAG TPA: metalloregulator ArsR/SmtB family transcription factor [Dongiaceae bacterium]|nr:metalloregulator ArsR/SmtB family transcription factor [Dongiaceae bacterium]
MARTAEMVSELMKSLAHPKRLLILCQLVEQERSVGELARLLDMREAAVSQQLSLLRKDKLVATRREGQTIWYSLPREDVRALLAYLYETYCAQPTRR